MSFDVMDGDWWMLHLSEANVKMFQSYDLLERYLLSDFRDLEDMIVKNLRVIMFHTVSEGKFEVIQQGDEMWRRVALKLLEKLEEEKR